jgi:hypothetical protein
VELADLEWILGECSLEHGTAKTGSLDVGNFLTTRTIIALSIKNLLHSMIYENFLADISGQLFCGSFCDSAVAAI